MDAKDWLRDTERKLKTVGCTDEEKLRYTAYLLSGLAAAWWESILAIQTRANGAQSAKGRNFGGNDAGRNGRSFGKLNCTNVEEVIHSDKAVIGTLNIMTYHGTVLFDTGATTSFISKEFTDVYGLRCNELKRAITILSAGGTICVTHRIEQQVLMICGCDY